MERTNAEIQIPAQNDFQHDRHAEHFDPAQEERQKQDDVDPRQGDQRCPCSRCNLPCQIRQ